MNKIQWEMFFKLLKRIIDLPADWQVKKDLILSMAKGNDSETLLSEFVENLK